MITSCAVIRNTIHSPIPDDCGISTKSEVLVRTFQSEIEGAIAATNSDKSYCFCLTPKDPKSINSTQLGIIKWESINVMKINGAISELILNAIFLR
jgi:hypothetical protein